VGVALSTSKWVALALLAALAAAPVAVSLRWGPTPQAAALLLAATWTALLVLLAWGALRRRSGRAQLGAALGLVLLVPVTVVLSQAAVYPQLWAVDLRAQAPRLEVPVAFLIGRHDVNAPPALAEDYYRRLEAPRKAWVWFERSGHTPWVSESERFVAVVAGTFLEETPSTGR
jgi:pimeloyl-ACP methyl ester carboxylesterase